VVQCSAPHASGKRGSSWLHAWHFFKHSDARRQDGVLIAKSLAYQLARRFPEVAKELLALDASAVAGLQRPDEALEMLVLQLLKALPAGTRPVFLFDALDEADPPGANTALANRAVRCITALHAAGALVVVTTRPKPPHIVAALKGRWGDAFSESTPSQYLRAGTAAAGDVSEAWRARLTEKASSKIFCMAAGALLAADKAAAPPASLAAAYEAIFSRSTGVLDNMKVKALLQLLMAACEPPSSSSSWASGRPCAVSRGGECCSRSANPTSSCCTSRWPSGCGGRRWASSERRSASSSMWSQASAPGLRTARSSRWA